MKVRKPAIATCLVLALSLPSCNLLSDKQVQYIHEATTYMLTAIAQARQTVPSETSSTPTGIFFVVDVGANCRKGPGTEYDKIGSFAQGSSAPLVGRNEDSTWWYVLNGSKSCWISGTTGHTTGDISSLPVVVAPPTPAPVPGPTLSDPQALVTELSYPSNCTSDTLQVTIRVTDAGKGIDSVWLSYRFLGDGGYTGDWHTVSPNDSASGGVNGFNYTIGAKAAGELGTQNGTLEYQFFARDNSGNTASYPNDSVLSMPIKFCP